MVVPPGLAQQPPPKQPPGRGDGEKKHQLTPKELRTVVVISIYVLSLLVLFVYGLVAVWPANAMVVTNSTATSTVRFLNATYTITDESRVLLIVAIVGVIGALVQSMWALGAFVGEKEFEESWVLWYVAHPFVGAGLAEIVYFALRAGLLSTGTTVANLNLFGVAALAGIAGMFTKDVMKKLKELSGDIFGVGIKSSGAGGSSGTETPATPSK